MDHFALPRLGRTDLELENVSTAMAIEEHSIQLH